MIWQSSNRSNALNCHAFGRSCEWQVQEITERKERIFIMKKLNYEVLKENGYKGYVLKDAPEKVLQFEKAISCAHLWIILSM